MLVVISSPAHCTERGAPTCMEINLGREFHFQSIAVLYDAHAGLRDFWMDGRGFHAWPAPVCHPWRGFVGVFGQFSHRFRSGLRCDVPPGLQAK